MEATTAEVSLAYCDFFKALPPDEERAEDVGLGPWRFRGIASDESPDVEDDSILRKALDLSYAQSRGFVNWEHSPEPEHQIGYLTKAELINPSDVKRFQDQLGVKLSKSASVFVEGELYQYVSKAEAVANLLKSAPPGKGLGLSLQGALARDPENGAVLKAFVRGVAITSVPAHPRTLAQLSKSLRTGEALAVAAETQRDLVDSCDSLDPSVKRYVDGRIEELRRSIEPEEGRQFSRDEALMEILRRFPQATLPTAERILETVTPG